MDIYFMRHGKAQERSSNIASDSKRALTEVGKKEIENIAKSLNVLGINFDEIISSPLDRAKQTGEIILKHTKIKKNMIIWDELKPETDAAKTIAKLAMMKFNSVLIIGHEPLLTNLVSKIIASEAHVNISLKKGGIIHVRKVQEGTKFVGVLRSIMTPKQLKKICK